MPDKRTIERAMQDKREGKSPTTQAGEFVREEMDHIRAGKHGARSAKQAIAIGLSKARRAGVKLPPPKQGTASAQTRRKAGRDAERGASNTRGARNSARDASTAGTNGASKRSSPQRSRAAKTALKREGRSAASKTALARQAKSAARKRTPAQRSAAARKAARTRAQHRSADRVAAS